MAGGISKSRSMCFPVLCGDAMTKQNSKAGGGDNAEYYITFDPRNPLAQSCYSRCLSIRGYQGRLFFLHTTYNRFVPTMPRCCRQRKHPRVVSLDAAAPGGASDCSS